MRLFAKPAVALGFGAFFLCAATCADFDQVIDMPLSLVPDWTAGVLLIGGAVISGRNWRKGCRYQIAAWAFMVSLLFGSFLANLQDWVSHSPDATGTTGLVALSQGTYVVVVGLLLALALVGLVSSLVTTHDDSRAISSERVERGSRNAAGRGSP
jgi:hypothetical protein